MTSQAKISAFFKTPAVSVATKRLMSSKSSDRNATAEVENKDSPVSKKTKTNADEGNEENKESSNSLSPDVKRKIEDNRTAAKLKLLGSQTHGVVANVGISWFSVLESEFNKDYFKELSSFVSSERQKGKIYPPSGQVFSWTKACDVSDVKVVILGQDPYHGPGQAHGLCFSVLPGVRPPPSLVNMFKELESDIEGFKKPHHGNLTGWATQGVLLLNACLTVRGGQANSHAGKGWEKLTDAVIHWFNSNSKGIVFMLWGAYAQKKCSFIDQKRHHILKSVHPSPLSAHRGFLGCKHFSKCNELLTADGNSPIDWNFLPEHGK